MKWSDLTTLFPSYFTTLPDIAADNMSTALYFGKSDLLQHLITEINKKEKSVLQDHLVFLACDLLAQVASEATQKAYFDWHVVELGAKPKPFGTSSERALQVVQSMLSPELEKEFAKERYTSKIKTDVEELVDDMRSALYTGITNLEWVEVETARELMAKLIRMKADIGGPKKYRMLDGLWDAASASGATEEVKEMERVKHVNNTQDFPQLWMEWNLWDWKTDMSGLFKPPPSADLEFDLKVYEVQAVHMPQSNKFTIPAGILELPFYGYDTYEGNAGAIGAVIGHEMMHAYDPALGAAFDSQGRERNFWAGTDRQDYTDKYQAVIDHYDTLRSIPAGEKINGTQTVTENVADIGALQLALIATKQHYNTTELSTTQLRNFCESWASVWRAKMTKEYDTWYVKNDKHSPNPIRTFAPLSHIPEWYEAYNVTAERKNYLEPSKRFVMWPETMVSSQVETTPTAVPPTAGSNTTASPTVEQSSEAGPLVLTPLLLLFFTAKLL